MGSFVDAKDRARISMGKSWNDTRSGVSNSAFPYRPSGLPASVIRSMSEGTR